MMEKHMEEILGLLLEGRLQAALNHISFVYSKEKLVTGYDEFETIEKDYKLMKNYILQGVVDPQREEQYRALLERTYRVASNLLLEWKCTNLGLYKVSSDTSDRLQLNNEEILENLEKFVSDVGLLSLEEGTDNYFNKAYTLYAAHQTTIRRLFNGVIVSPQWKLADKNFYEQLLLSPTIDQNDQLVLVSAISISNMNHFDINKFKTLVDVYTKTDDSRVKERAFVGWALSLHDGMSFLPEQQDIVIKLCEDESTVRELYSLQRQLFATLDTEKDSQEIQNNIMPDIVNNSKFTMTKFGIEEREDDITENILNPNAEDERMEKMEESVRRMVNMQRQGSDIYFSGFGKMKEFPFFFKSVCNWFTPFRFEHPDMIDIAMKFKNKKFLNTMVELAQLCDSDKYSLALILSDVVDRMPKDMIEMLESEEAQKQMAGQDFDRNNPIVIRRTYLQDIYRFYRLNSFARELVNPFDDNGECTFNLSVFFFKYQIFKGTKLESKKLSLANYLYKHQKYGELEELLETFQSPDPGYAILSGYAKLYNDDPNGAIKEFDKALEIVPDNIHALQGKARAAMVKSDFGLSAEIYTVLQELEPDRRDFFINYCVALLKTNRVKQVLERLYKEYFSTPDDKSLKRLIAWAQLCNGDITKAANIYESLLNDEPTPEDYLNAGYSHWLQKDLKQAVSCFREFIGDSDAGIVRLREEFKNDRYMLRSNGVSEIDELLMGELIQP